MLFASNAEEHAIEAWKVIFNLVVIPVGGWALYTLIQFGKELVNHENRIKNLEDSKSSERDFMEKLMKKFLE